MIAEDQWPQIVRPLGFDAGIRTLQRTIKGMVRKAARQIVEGSIQKVELNATNIKLSKSEALPELFSHFDVN